MNKRPALFIILGVVILLLLTLAPSVYFFSKYRETQKLLSRNPLILETEDSQLLEKIGKLIDLPQNEKPTIATVTDVEKIKQQAFFAKAKNGDKVLIYQNSKKAILYDPVANKILEVGPLLQPTQAATAENTATIAGQAIAGAAVTAAPTATPKTSPTSAPTPTPTPDTRVKVVLYNGTTTVGITSPVESLLQDEFPQAQVIDKDTAQKKDYESTTVIDLTGDKENEAQQIAQLVGGKVASLPGGESKPKNGDILIIVGKE